MLSYNTLGDTGRCELCESEPSCVSSGRVAPRAPSRAKGTGKNTPGGPGHTGPRVHTSTKATGTILYWFKNTGGSRDTHETDRESLTWSLSQRHLNLTNQPQNQPLNQPHPPTHAPDHANLGTLAPDTQTQQRQVRHLSPLTRSTSIR